MTSMLRLTILASLFFPISWAAHADEQIKLRSGKTVDVLAIAPLVSTHGWSALELQYRTTIPLDQMAMLREEADEIWDTFVVDVDKGGYESAVISANEPAQGFIVQSNQGWNFIFEKIDGSWRTDEPRDRVKSKLDANFVKEFIARLDRLHDRSEMNALLLYMANDFAASLSDETRAGSSPQTLNRMQFVSVENSALSQMTDHHHIREILNISISNNGATAIVTSRESSQMTIGSHKVSGVERSTDTFQLLGDTMLWKRSESALVRKSEGN